MTIQGNDQTHLRSWQRLRHVGFGVLAGVAVAYLAFVNLPVAIIGLLAAVAALTRFKTSARRMWFVLGLAVAFALTLFLFGILFQSFGEGSEGF